MSTRRGLAAFLLTITAVAAVEQLRRPVNERTWRGRVAGVPYDFRAPTMDSVIEKIWDPENPSICAPTLWGVGWTFNLYRLAHPLES
jgi:hypothetical protein